jgi:hypothetical protein
LEFTLPAERKASPEDLKSRYLRFMLYEEGKLKAMNSSDLQLSYFLQQDQ